MSLEAELQCPECKRLIKDVNSLDSRECPWCGAFLVNVNPENNNSTSSKRTAKPGLFDEIDVSDDDEFTTTTTTQPKLSRLQQDNDDDDDGHEFSLENILSQFKQEMKHRPMSSARPKRRKVELFDELDDSEDDDDDWNVSITSKKNNNKKKKKKGKETQLFQVSDEDLDAVKEDRLNTNKKRYNLSFPSDSGSEYTLSDSEGSLLESSEDEQERKTKSKDDPQDYKPDPVKKAAKAKETSKSSPAATTKETKAKALPSASSSSTTPSASRPLGSFLIFNKEMRGKLAKENKDLSQKDLSRLVSGMWNKMSKEQKAKYANMKPTAKKLVPPPGNGYVLFKKEQFPLVQKEYNLKGEHIMRTVSTLIGVRWKNLDPDLRESYTQRAKQARQEWALQHPHEYEVFMNNMKAKVSQAKKGKKRTKAQ